MTKAEYVDYKKSVKNIHFFIFDESQYFFASNLIIDARWRASFIVCIPTAELKIIQHEASDCIISKRF